MEQNKLENQIREKLNSREIQPSAQAWDRLDAMLSVAEEKKTKRSFGWLYIAASIMVLLTVGMFLFTQKDTGPDNQNTVVESEVMKDSIQKEENKFQTPINKIQENKESQVAVSTETPNPKSQNQAPNKEEVSVINQNQKNNQQSINQNPLINREKQIEFQNSSDVALKELPKIETGKEFISSNNKSDEFLLAGLDKTASQSTNKKASVKVDAKSLLSQVDGELELTFREKVIDKVSKNYKEIKVALANRNQE
jgi:hypothetical protein